MRISPVAILLACLACAALPGAAPAQQAPVDPAAVATSTAAFAVKVTGKGRPMILIPGLACSGAVWDSTVEHFKGEYECHVLTLAGFAGQPPIKPPMLETVRKQLADYIRTHHLDHPVVIGHSIGGFMAFSLASSEPDLVGPVVAVDGVPFYAALMNPMATAESAKNAAEATRASMSKSTREEFNKQNRAAVSMMITDTTKVDLAAKWGEASDINSVANAMADMMGTDLREKVSAIKTPTLLMGASSFATTPEMKKMVAGAYEAQVVKIPHHQVAMAEKSRHFIMYDDPTFFFSTLDEFLKKR